MTVIATAADHEGRRVELTDTQWAHIVKQRGSRLPSQETILRAVSAPDDVLPGRKPDELWFYLETTSPSRWLRVVVAYDGERGFIVTAFPRRRKP